MRKSLTRQERLRGTSNLEGIFKNSSRVGCSGAKLLFRENGLDYCRVVLSPVRKYGHAVARNRARRLGKEAYRQVKTVLKPGFDLAFILYPGDYSYGERINQFSSLLKRAGLLRED